MMKAELLDHMGDDLAVVNAARVSFEKESEWDEGYGVDENGAYSTNVLSQKDSKLIRYLARHNHWTPFAHTAIKFRVSAPVPIRTQCFKHKFGFVENEESRRYIKSTPELYVPDEFRQAAESVKQGSAGVHPKTKFWMQRYLAYCESQITIYERMIFDGVCPEQARFILPQGCMVNWIWTGSLAAYARFYRQRTDPHAQKEVQQLARLIGDQIEPLFPVSWRALTNG